LGMREEHLLVERCRRGDTEAFRQLVEPYADRLFSTLCGMIGSREDTEDLLQEVLLAAYRSLGSFRREASFYTWSKFTEERVRFEAQVRDILDESQWKRFEEMSRRHRQERHAREEHPGWKEEER